MDDTFVSSPLSQQEAACLDVYWRAANYLVVWIDRIKKIFVQTERCMQTQVQIVFRNMASSDALTEHIREKVAKLEEFSAGIIGCHVTVEVPHKHHHQGKKFNVRVDLKVPGAELVATRDQNEDVYVALREAFDHAKRQLEEQVRRQRGNVKHHEATWHQTIRANGPPSE